MTGLRRLALPRAASTEGLSAALKDAMTGNGPALLPYGADAGPPPVTSTTAVPDGVALVVGTSGSTGPVKLAMLSAGNLVASATSTHEALGGPGAWLLAIPPTHIAGLQVVVRTIVAGTALEEVDLEAGFTPDGFVEAARRLTATDPGRRYTALVPTQLTRLLADPEGVAALAGFDTVLIGGAALAATTRAEAERAGVRIVHTYGMSETAGGCVYDGQPLPVSLVHIDNDQHVVLGGDTVALGYLGQPRLTEDHFAVDPDGVRWFRTDDLGRLDDRGRLAIRGRADDLINTGGLKVAPGGVEDAIVRFVPGVADAVVVGTEHPTWGQAVSAAVTMRHGAPQLSVRDLRARLRGILPDHALPQRLLVLDTIPQRGPGKPDRRALVMAFGATMDADGRSNAGQAEGTRRDE